MLLYFNCSPSTEGINHNTFSWTSHVRLDSMAHKNMYKGLIRGQQNWIEKHKTEGYTVQRGGYLVDQ